MVSLLRLTLSVFLLSDVVLAQADINFQVADDNTAVAKAVYFDNDGIGNDTNDTDFTFPNDLYNPLEPVLVCAQITLEQSNDASHPYYSLANPRAPPISL